MISFEFPERHIKDYLAASRIYYDPDYENSRIGIVFKELFEQKRTPWVISLQFDNKKLTSKAPWNELVLKIEQIFESDF
jgi:hypothetical protein